MLKKLQIPVLFSFLLLCGCQKDKQLGGDAYIRGNLTWQNQYSEGSKVLPVQKGLVYISKSQDADSVNYYYSTKTDSLGYFTFTGLNKDEGYLLFYKDTLQGNPYEVYQTAEPSVRPISLLANISQTNATGLKLLLTDENGGLVGKANVYLYRSKVLADSRDPLASSFQVKSDVNGQALQLRMAPGIWYAYANFQTDSIRLQNMQDYVVTNNNLTLGTIVLKK